MEKPSGIKGNARRCQHLKSGGIAKKTWADVVKARGINVQIVLGNGNLGHALAPQRKRGERRGGVSRRGNTE
jgi:hypothetical protein